VASVLYGMAVYLFGGANMRAGNTVQGLAADQRWRITEQVSLVKP
jgi:hypothetical protein